MNNLLQPCHVEAQCNYTKAPVFSVVKSLNHTTAPDEHKKRKKKTRMEIKVTMHSVIPVIKLLETCVGIKSDIMLRYWNNMLL